MRNNADSLVYQTEKTVKIWEAKISDADKSTIEAKVADVKKGPGGTDTAAIEAATGGSLPLLPTKFSAKAYQAQSAQGAPGAEGTVPAQKDENVVDADYEVVDD